MNYSDRRGALVTEWIATNGFVILNQGRKPTFESQNYGSILDLTIATDSLASQISNWEVADRESLSDHNYITFELSDRNRTMVESNKNSGWQVRKLDKQKLHDTMNALGETILSSTDFRQKLSQICDESMPRKKSVKRKQPAYWWNEDIAQLRKECLRIRRRYTRSARRNSIHVTEEIWEEYRESKRRLTMRIKKAKRDCWKRICDNVDRDIWGDGYKIVMRGLLGYPPRLNLSMNSMEKVVSHLFPIHKTVIFACDTSCRFLDFSLEELQSAVSRLKNNRAAGPGNIPPEVLKMVATERPDVTLSIYNRLGHQAKFPDEWKRARLVLLRKGDKPLENPSSYRPICLLDVEGKLFEQLIVTRLNKELERTGGLSVMQYGFIKGKQTVDAINEVLRIAREAENYTHAHRRLCVMITLDVKNAFNSASWQIILEKLRTRKIDESLISILASYLSNREIQLEANEGIKNVQVNSGVPQGSVLGPTLWNIQYDDLLRQEMPNGTTLVGFADDIAMMVTARDEELLMLSANTGLQRVANWLENQNLSLAPEKTEAVLFSKRRKVGPISFSVKGTQVNLSRAVKYLGVWLDTKLTFAEHVNRTILKTERTVTALTGLMPNIGGPRASKRRTLSSVVHSQILYGTPAWYTATENKKSLRKLNSLQRKMSLRICCAYRTVSTEGIGVIAGVPPIELLIIERRERYAGVSKTEARTSLLRKWQEKWNRGTYGRWTYKLIPNIEAWLNRSHGEVDYFITQALSGHGCFYKYLYDRGKVNTSSCMYCKLVDDAQHTLFECSQWVAVRNAYLQGTGRHFTPETFPSDLLTCQKSWNRAYKVVRTIIETKERDQRHMRHM